MAMKILVIGGSVFLGRHLVAESLARGHSVTIFHRGLENSQIFPSIEHVFGDRGCHLNRLGDRVFDAVIDTCGYFPELVSRSAEVLVDSGTYVFISSVAVYRRLGKYAVEDGAVHNPRWGRTLNRDTVGPLKVACEQAVRTTFDKRALIVRAGLLIGTNDVASDTRVDGLDYDRFSPRFPYWPLRIASGGEILAPGRVDSPVQVLDAEDLAVWIVKMVDGEQCGTFNAAGPMTTMAAMLSACGALEGQLTWVEDDFLITNCVRPIVDIPFWVPQHHSLEDLMRLPTKLAVDHGLRYRSLSKTASETLAWTKQLASPAIAVGRHTIAHQQEKSLLSEWGKISTRRLPTNY